MKLSIKKMGYETKLFSISYDTQWSFLLKIGLLQSEVF